MTPPATSGGASTTTAEVAPAGSETARSQEVLAPPDRAVRDLAPYDAVLLLSFGGPEGPDDVMPFLRAVTAGRGVPDERLVEVAEHYHHFGGRSPINDQNRALLAALRAELDRRGLDVDVVWGNRNWTPYVTDVLREVHRRGARRIVTIMTSAYSSYSSCRQYREDLASALLTLADEGVRLDVDLRVDRVRPYYNHPGFVEPMVRVTRDALSRLPAGSHVAFVTHSIPEAMDAGSGPHGHAYTAQHRDLARTIAAAVAGEARAETGRPIDHPIDRPIDHPIDHPINDSIDQATGQVVGTADSGVPWSLVYCSRSGSPHQPWLEPDIGDLLRDLAARQVPGVAVVPIGFVSDHMEVVYDLDTEAREIAEQLGLPFVRAATVGTDPRFVSGLVDLLLERAAQARAEQPERPVLGRQPPVHVECPAGCCPNPRAARPAACGEDWSPAASA